MTDDKKDIRNVPITPKIVPAEELTDIEKLKKQSDEYLDGWKRAKADYLNLKKDSAKREEEIVKFANATLIMEIMPIYNHLKLSFKHVPAEQKNSHWVKGIEHIISEFRTFLQNIGIDEIKTVGEQFNSELHEAVAKEKMDGKPHGAIIEEVQPGYQYHGKALQAAKVKIAE